MRFEKAVKWSVALAVFALIPSGTRLAQSSLSRETAADLDKRKTTKVLHIIFPPPRKLERKREWILSLPIQIKAPKALEAPANLLKRELEEMFGKNAVAGKGSTIISLELDNRNLSREEEYAVETGENKVTLRAHDLQGAFWAVHSFLQLISSPSIRRTPKGWQMVGVKIHDYPQSNFRAFMIQGAWVRDIEAFRMTLELLARLKVRYVAIEFGPQVVLDFEPTMVRGARFSKSQAKSLIDYARSLGLEPIGYLNLLGHLERAYQKPPYTEHGGIMLQSDEVYERFVFPILTEMLEIYGQVNWFHCGMDEAWELFEWLSRQGYDSAQLLTRHITKINGFLKQHGVKMVIWHDMLFSPDLVKEIGSPIGPANGGPPQNTAKAIDLIPKDVVLNYWFYEPFSSYPALDWLRQKGFEVWASPWQTPFSLVRYAQARNIPTMGTIWADPPNCFISRSLAATIALYAWASWNPESAPEGINPEREILAQALQVTQSTLWRRRNLVFPSPTALLVNSNERKIARRISMPEGIDKAPEQHFGVPFDFSSSFVIPTLKGFQRPFERLTEAAFVLLPDGTKLKIDGLNRFRGEDELIIYASPRKSTGTNIYGAEVAISATGEVIEVVGYGSGDTAIPPNGIVLSAHSGPKGRNYSALLNLKIGDRIGILDKDGNLIGGYGGLVLKVELPSGEVLKVDGMDKARGEDELVLYQPSFRNGRTGTNQWGVEVIVIDGKVAEVRNWVGDAPIPLNGLVLSAHWGKTSKKAEALSKLKQGDAIKVWVSTQNGDFPLEQILASATWKMALNEKCRTIFFVMATEASSSRGKPLGNFVAEFADGSVEVIPIRYGLEALPLHSEELPLPPIGETWLICREQDKTLQKLLVREWINRKPNVPIAQLQFLPTIHAVEAGTQICAIAISTNE